MSKVDGSSRHRLRRAEADLKRVPRRGMRAIALAWPGRKSDAKAEITIELSFDPSPIEGGSPEALSRPRSPEEQAARREEPKSLAIVNEEPHIPETITPDPAPTPAPEPRRRRPHPVTRTPRWYDNERSIFGRDIF